MVATSFWALLWGFVGLLIATPLTVCLVVIGRASWRRWRSWTCCSAADRRCCRRRRSTSGRWRGAPPRWCRRRASRSPPTSRAEYYDHVALPGAGAGACGTGLRDALELERLDPVHEQIGVLLEALAPERCAPPRRAGARGRRTGAILCLPARGDLDDLAATMAVQALREAGFGARAAPNTILDNVAADKEPDFSRACGCAAFRCSRTAPSVAAIRFFVRRMQRKMTGAIVVVGLWGAVRPTRRCCQRCARRATRRT